ncbi:protein phosphatase 2C domain-containing protein [Ruminococcus albus]|uniref:Serine/threonine protein phosphatase PrpC n=1 Tax=Ruminococcus albus TaxID=1264 RepID=A0A1I1G0S8_RUMAL|nr:protein phosphatase 2C domain-containing protein [Ruminococcus albus]SFC05111.1 Serine/threonine protein phosphatase PrpC [Ruminococcus albus]
MLSPAGREWIRDRTDGGMQQNMRVIIWGMLMRYYIYGYTDTGSGRKNNEDAVLVNKEVINEGFREAVLDAPFITAVCDGMGEESAGGIAAGLCLRELASVSYTSKTDLKQSLMAIHGKIKKRSTQDKASANIQTTLCAFAVDEDGKGLCINVGDSRIYRYVNGAIRQLTTDQSYGQYMFSKGEIDNVEELDPEEREAVISAMGSPQSDPLIDQTPLVNEFGTEPDDMIIITTDGLSDFVSENEFEIGLAMDLPISEKLVAMAKLAVLNGSTDNISIIGIKPFIDFEELSALTRHDAVGTTVNVMEMLEEHEGEEEKDELSDILTIDLEAIIGKSKPVFPPEYGDGSLAKTEPEPMTDQQPDNEPDPEMQAESEQEPEIIPEPTIEKVVEPVYELQTESDCELQQVLAPEPEMIPEQEPETEPEPQPEFDTEPEPVSGADDEMQSETEDVSEEESEAIAKLLQKYISETKQYIDQELEEETEQPVDEEEPVSAHEVLTEEHHDMVSREEIELEAHDLFMQAQASLSRLSGLIPKKKKI